MLDPQTWQLETARLTMRSAQPDDGALWHESVQDSFVRLQPWFDHWRELPSRAEFDEFCRYAEDAFRKGDGYYLKLLRRDDDAFVGSIDIRRMNARGPTFEIGYWMRDGFAGHGYVPEAARALTDWAFTDLRAERIDIRCDARNLASRRAAEKSGFALEAVLRREARSNDGEMRDTCVYVRFPP